MKEIEYDMVVNIITRVSPNFWRWFYFQRHINNIVKSGSFYICDIARIYKHLSLHVTITLENTLVSSRLDYYNSLLYTVPVTYLD